jgi:monoamine oxidase
MPDGGSVRTYDCIVLGAGIAGVTAARNLQQLGLRVLLLEGSHRIGGRMYSKRAFVRNPRYVPHPENPEEEGRYIPVEAGAEYIHIEEKEWYREFWAEIRRHGFRTSRFSKSGALLPPEIPRNRIFLSSEGRTVPTLATLLDLNVLGMVSLVFDLQQFDPKTMEDTSGREYVRAQGYRGLGRSMAEYTLSAHTPGLLDEPDPRDPPGGPGSRDTISVAGIVADGLADQFLEPAEFRLELDQNWNHRICGYDTLPAKIAEEFLRLGGRLERSEPGGANRKVTRVERSPGGTVTVRTQGGEEFSGRSAICTFSVGMLDPQTGEGARIFGNLISQRKRDALSIVKMGAITKLSLEFKERRWKGHGPWSEQMSVLSNPEGDARTFFSAFPDEPEGPHVLTALLMSKDHEKIKDKNDGEAIQHLLDVLQRIYDPEGQRWTPEVVLVGEYDGTGRFVPNYFRQDWSKDEFAKGGNSFLKYAPKEERQLKITEAREALKDPRDTLPLFWAGEATAPAYNPNYQPLSVHGAYISGVGVAEDVHHYLRVCNGNEEAFGAFYEKKYSRMQRTPRGQPVKGTEGPDIR